MYVNASDSGCNETPARRTLTQFTAVSNASVTIGSGPIVMNVLPSTTHRSERVERDVGDLSRVLWLLRRDGNTGCSRRRLISESTGRYPIVSCDLPSARCRCSLHQKSGKYESSRPVASRTLNFGQSSSQKIASIPCRALPCDTYHQALDSCWLLIVAVEFPLFRQDRLQVFGNGWIFLETGPHTRNNQADQAEGRKECSSFSWEVG